VTLVVAAINAERPRHYTAGDSSFEGDYIYSLKQVLKLGVPTVVFLQAEFVPKVAEELHPLVSVRGVTNVSASTSQKTSI